MGGGGDEISYDRVAGGGRKFKARPDILGGNWTIFLASRIVFFIMVEYFCLSSKIKSEIIKAKHPT